MIVKLSIILDHQSDVFREIKIDSSTTLEELHGFIVQVFELNKGEMAAFYLTNEDWEQNEEIPLIAMDANSMEMSKLSINDIFSNHDKLLYVNDFFVMWRFMIEAIEKDEENTIDSPELFLSFGKMPEDTPQVQFVSEKDPYSSKDEDFFDGEHDEFNEFESYDEY